jgi:23S rRNA pseudouridine1911/1915/1917 synthase
MTRKSRRTKNPIRFRTGEGSEAGVPRATCGASTGAGNDRSELAGEGGDLLISVTVPQTGSGKRLDQFLAGALAPEFSRARTARLVKSGLVTVNGVPARQSAVLRVGDRIEAFRPLEVRPDAPISTNAPEIEILYEDPELIAVNKPAGMTVHPAPGNPDSTLVDALLARFPELMTMAEPDGVLRPGIVHRLDKQTSGVMVVARTPFARMELARQFKDRTVRKLYLALVKGVIAQDSITISRPIGRHPVERKKMSVRSRTPREAISHVRTIFRFQGPEPASLLAVRPETGRTHQIRVHLASIGHPCLGDPLYGRASGEDCNGWANGRQALHAAMLTVRHPRTGDSLEFRASIPTDISAFLLARGFGDVNSVLTLIRS